MPNPTFSHSRYLGGLPNTKEGREGNLVWDDECIGIGVLNPKRDVVRWEEVAQIGYESETIKKSRLGKAVVFGVFALAAKSSRNDATVTLFLKDGNIAVFQVKNKQSSAVRAKLSPFAVAAGVSCADDAVAQTNTTKTADQVSDLVAPTQSGAVTDEQKLGSASLTSSGPAASVSLADELAKLKGLLDGGVLTDEEFAAAKQRLITPPPA